MLAAFSFVVGSIISPDVSETVRGELPQYYIAAELVANGHQDSLYDLQLQLKRHEELTGVRAHLPFVSAPHLAVFFLPITLVPLRAAYLVWFVVSVALYSAAVLLVAAPGRKESALWLSLAFPAYLVDTVILGQVSALAIAPVAAAIALERRGHHTVSGAALGFCAYKPTLLIWLVPMLLVRRRWRALAGFAASVAGLTVLSLLVVGPKACLDFIQILLRWTRNTTDPGSSDYIFPTFKYVDLHAFGKLLPVSGTAVWIAIGAVAALGAAAVIRIWLRADAERAWAAALTATSLLNLYTPIYDSVLIVPAVLILAAKKADRNFRIITGALFLTALVSEHIAHAGGPQIFTLAVIAFLAYQYRGAQQTPSVWHATAGAQAVP